MQIKTILESCLYVADLEAAEKFYTTVLGLRWIELDPNRHVFFQLASSMLLIFNSTTTSVASGGLPAHGTIGASHLAFAVPESELDEWDQQLQRHHVAIEKRIAWPAGGRSLYFRDPAGNSLEIATPSLWKLSAATQDGDTPA